MDAAWAVVVGVVIGGLLTAGTTLLADKLRADRESALDSAKRSDDRRLAHDQFQRETLLALQDALLDLTHSAMTRCVKERDAGRIGTADAIPTGELAQTERAVRERIQALNTRVADHEARRLVDVVFAKLWTMLTAPSADVGDDAVTDAGETVAALLTRSGELIRGTFRAE
jgi:hypothetical protein